MADPGAAPEDDESRSSIPDPIVGDGAPAPGAPIAAVPDAPDDKPKKKRGRPKKAQGQPARKGRPPKLENLEAELTDFLTELIAPVAFFAPLVALVWISRAERTSHAIMLIAKRDAKVQAVVERIVRDAAYATLAGTAIAMIVAAQVEFFGAAPDGWPAKLTGVDDAFVEVYPDGLGDAGDEPAEPTQGRGMLG